MMPTIFAVRRPAQAVHSLVRSSGLDRVLEGLGGFRKVGRMQECLPAAMLKILQSQAAVVQKGPIDVVGVAIRPSPPKEGWDRFDDFAQVVFALAQRGFGTLLVVDVKTDCIPVHNRTVRVA